MVRQVLPVYALYLELEETMKRIGNTTMQAEPPAQTQDACPNSCPNWLKGMAPEAGLESANKRSFNNMQVSG
jgi:hypothetical protein